MIVEELVAKLGFKVDGLDQIKKFDQTLDKAKKGLEDFGKKANKSLYSDASKTPLKGMTDGMSKTVTMGDKFRAFFDRIKSGAANTAVSMARFGASLAGVLLRIGGGAAIIGQMTIALFKMASAAALAASKAAILRREQQMSARGNKTTAANIDKVSAGLEAQGFDGDKAKEIVASVAEKVDEAIREDGGKAFAKKTGVPVLDARGRQRDSSAVTLDFIKLGLNRRKAAEDARFAADGLDPKSKAGRAADKKANALELKNRKDFEDWGMGVTDVLRKIKEGVTAADFEREAKKHNALNPPPTKAQEDRSAFIADQAGELKAILEALAKPLQDAKDAVLANVLPALTGFGKGLISLGKAFGWINETAEEITAKKAAIDAIPKTAKDINENPQNYRDDKTLWGALARKMKDAEQAAQPTADVPLPPRRAATPDMGSFKPSTDDAISGLAAFAGALRATTTEVQSRNGPAAVAKDTQAKIENDQRKYENIGNDQRTISVNTTVNQTVSGASAPAAAGAAVSGAASAAVSKATTANTGAASAP